MTRREYPYDVFISYRHLPADKAAAERLQKLLERHRKKDGKHLRVFRDQSELPTSSDLGADIRAALERSRFLVVVCSPSYQTSKWCMQELQYFRQLHGGRNTNILPLLVEGEPADVFPPELCREERQVTGDDGVIRTVSMEVEPLCADIRAATAWKRRRRLQTEYLRIAAPVLGVTFDSLYRRAQRRAWAMAATAAAAVLAFGIYSFAMLSQIRQQQREMYESQSLRLANEALPLAAEDPELAILLADTALPGNLDNPEYAILPEAELALRSAVLQRAIEMESSPLVIRCRIPLSSSHWEIGGFYNGGRWLTVSDNSNTRLYDTVTGDLIATANQSVFYSRYNSSGAYFFNDGKLFVVAEMTFRSGEYTSFHYEMYDSLSGALLGRFDTGKDPEFHTTFPLYDEDSQRCYILQETRGTYCSLGWFDLSGSFTEQEDSSDQIQRLGAAEDPNMTLLGSFSSMMGLDLTYAYGDYMATLEDAPADYQAVMEAFSAQYGDQWDTKHISRSPDGDLYILHITRQDKSYYAPDSTLDGEATAFWYAPENRLLTLWEDCCVYVPELGLLVRVTDRELVLYSLNPALYGAPMTQEQHYAYISPDGTWVLELAPQDYRDYVNFGPMRLYLTADLGQPIVDVANSAGVAVSRNGEYLLYSDLDAGMTYLYHVPAQQVVFEAEGTHYYMTVNEDGSLIAWGQTHIEVLDTAAGEIIRTYDLAFPDAITGAAHHEFRDGKLLVLMDYDAYICDVYEDTEPLRLECGTSSSGMYGGFLGDICFTEDGLVLLPSDGIMVMGNPTVITAIYDLNTGAEVSFFSSYSDYGQDFLYDDITGTLVVQLANEFYAQRRNEAGDFEVVYTITPQAPDMEICTFEAATDGKYLVLNSPSQCEIYDITDGSLMYLLKNEGFAMAYYGVLDGVLCDLRAGQTGAIHTWRLPDTRQARQQVEVLLTRNGVRRTLSDQECAEYYIPAEWQ